MNRPSIYQAFISYPPADGGPQRLQFRKERMATLSESLSVAKGALLSHGLVSRDA